MSRILRTTWCRSARKSTAHADPIDTRCTLNRGVLRKRKCKTDSQVSASTGLHGRRSQFMYLGEFRRMEKSPNGGSTRVVFRLLVIKLYSPLSISAKTCWSATNAPRVPRTGFFRTGQSGPFRLQRIHRLEPSLASGFLEHARFPHYLNRRLRGTGRPGVAGWPGWPVARLARYGSVRTT
jgi:hypothetical protein